MENIVSGNWRTLHNWVALYRGSFSPSNAQFYRGLGGSPKNHHSATFSISSCNFLQIGFAKNSSAFTIRQRVAPSELCSNKKDYDTKSAHNPFRSALLKSKNCSYSTCYAFYSVSTPAYYILHSNTKSLDNLNRSISKLLCALNNSFANL